MGATATVQTKRARAAALLRSARMIVRQATGISGSFHLPDAHRLRQIASCAETMFGQRKIFS